MAKCAPERRRDDWNLCHHNTEETRDYEFQLEYGPSIASQRRLKKLRWFLGDELFRRTSLTMLFFWSVNNIRTSFTSRFGYRFTQHPHWDFCSEMNLALIDRIRPRAVFAESRPLLERYEREFNLTPAATYYDEDWSHVLDIRRLKNGIGIPFYCFDNLSARRGHRDIRTLVRRFVSGESAS
ncbi:MAG: hypothetical protein OXG15_03235 [Gammaproteobacteria bacterium]|nr:hypothetical protein [Gammaproteobacteria bacterium]